MNKITAIFLSLTIMLFLINGCNSEKDELTYRGLIGIYYSEPNFTSIKAITILTYLEQNWNEEVDFETGSSGI